MRIAPAAALGLLLLTGTAAAQSLDVAPDGIRPSRAPVRMRTDGALAMAELPVTQSPPPLLLVAPDGRRSGPFPLADGTRVQAGGRAYTLRLAEPAPFPSFTLQPADPAAAPLGPFTATNRAPVDLGHAAFSVLRPPASVTVSLSHPSRIAQSPAIALAPLTPALARELLTLRQKFAALASRIDTETADVRFLGVPRVTVPSTGSASSPVVRVSERDRLNSVRSAERSAVTYLESLFRSAFSVRSQAITDGLTYHFQPPGPGSYILCAMQRVKDPDAAAGAGSVTALWWTVLEADGQHPLSLSLTAENAITWREVFPLEPAR